MPRSAATIARATMARARKRVRSSGPMRTLLSAALAQISAYSAQHRAPPDARPIIRPEGAQFLSHTHVSAHGTIDYRLYVPSRPLAGPVPLVVMLHGCAQTPEDFATGTGMNALAEEQGFIVAYPEQTTGSNLNRCWNWYRPGDQVRGKGEPALINGLTRDILRDHPIDRARIYVAGLSAGGATAAIVANAYPMLFRAAGVHSGLPVGGARDLSSAIAAMRSGGKGRKKARSVPTIVFHGTADRTVHPDNGRAVVEQVVGGTADLKVARRKGKATSGREFRVQSYRKPGGPIVCEYWVIDGSGHAWAGGQRAGSFTDPEGPDASRAMMRFFLQSK